MKKYKIYISFILFNLFFTISVCYAVISDDIIFIDKKGYIDNIENINLENIEKDINNFLYEKNYEDKTLKYNTTLKDITNATKSIISIYHYKTRLDFLKNKPDNYEQNKVNYINIFIDNLYNSTKNKLFYTKFHNNYENDLNINNYDEAVLLLSNVNHNTKEYNNTVSNSINLSRNRNLKLFFDIHSLNNNFKITNTQQNLINITKENIDKLNEIEEYLKKEYLELPTSRYDSKIERYIVLGKVENILNNITETMFNRKNELNWRNIELYNNLIDEIYKNLKFIKKNKVLLLLILNNNELLQYHYDVISNYYNKKENIFDYVIKNKDMFLNPNQTLLNVSSYYYRY